MSIPQTLSISYTDGIRRKSKTFGGLRTDLTDDQIKDFAFNSAELVGQLEVMNTVVTTKRTII